jgi:hypothetical protein
MNSNETESLLVKNAAQQLSQAEISKILGSEAVSLHETQLIQCSLCNAWVKYLFSGVCQKCLTKSNN